MDITQVNIIVKSLNLLKTQQLPKIQLTSTDSRSPVESTRGNSSRSQLHKPIVNSPITGFPRGSGGGQAGRLPCCSSPQLRISLANVYDCSLRHGRYSLGVAITLQNCLLRVEFYPGNLWVES